MPYFTCLEAQDVDKYFTFARLWGRERSRRQNQSYSLRCAPSRRPTWILSVLHSEKVFAPRISPRTQHLRALRRIAPIGASYPESNILSRIDYSSLRSFLPSHLLHGAGSSRRNLTLLQIEHAGAQRSIFQPTSRSIHMWNSIGRPKWDQIGPTLIRRPEVGELEP